VEGIACGLDLLNKELSMKSILFIFLIAASAFMANARFLLRYYKPAAKFTSEKRANPNELG
jgi:hypothetical protein